MFGRRWHNPRLYAALMMLVLFGAALAVASLSLLAVQPVSAASEQSPLDTPTFTATHAQTCTPTRTPTRTRTVTPTATPTPCGLNRNYQIATGTATIVPGVTDAGNHTDDGTTNITLPFTFV